MTYSFNPIDPANRLCQHFFEFHVAYGQDEQTLVVLHGAYVKTYGV
jgi:hypothetical protein